jgi:5-methylthioadenosine/S-adenosylhomocysteine deaminase
MRIIIKDALVVPMTTQDDHFLGSISIENGKIVALNKEKPNFKADKVIDGSSFIALPGLINAHTHASMVLFRNYKDSVADLQSWLDAIWPLEDLLVEKDIYLASLLAITEMIKSGTTCFADFYFMQNETAKAAAKAKIKVNLGLTLFGDAKESEKRIKEQLPQLKKWQVNSKGLIKYDIAPHSVYTCTTETLKIAKEVAQKENCKVHIHVSETVDEVERSYKNFNKSPVAYLNDLGILVKDKAYIAHAVHLDDNDITIIKENKIPVVHNPSSNSKLGCGIAPIAHYKDSLISIALGTDGAASNNNLDLFNEMRLAAMLSGALTKNPMALSPFEILQMATINGAKALGRDNECGTLEVGKDADIILIDTQAIHLTPLNNIYSALVYATKSSDVDTVLCKGEILLENKILKTIDFDKLKRQFLATWEDIKMRQKTEGFK